MKIAVPEFVYFDLGKVLLGFSHQHACDRIADVSGVSPDRVRAFFTPDHSLNRLECGQITVPQLYEEFCLAFECRPDMEAMTSAGSDIFSLNIEIVPLVAQLSVAGVRMGILSNTNQPHWQFVADGRFRIVADYFDVLALSYEMGEMKPASRIYEQAAEMANVDPGRIFFTDDRPENVEGAKSAGWQAVLFSSAADLAREFRRSGLRFNY